MDEIILVTGVQLLIDPAGATYSVYNNMLGDDPLLVSSHGNLEKKWLRVQGGDYLKFATPVWLLQYNGGQQVLPCYETAAAVVPPAVP